MTPIDLYSSGRSITVLVTAIIVSTSRKEAASAFARDYDTHNGTIIN